MPVPRLDELRPFVCFSHLLDENYLDEEGRLRRHGRR